MTNDEMGKLFFDIRCGPNGDMFWEAMRELCLVGIKIDLCTPGKLDTGEMVVALNTILPLSQPVLNLTMGKQSVFHDMDRFARHGEKLCRPEIE